MAGPIDVVEALLPEMEMVRRVRLDSDIDWYSFLSRAAFAKAFDFAHWALLQEDESGISFFSVSTLRGIIEEIILLSAVRSIPRQDRDKLLNAWMHVEFLEGTRKQAEFFATPDRFQSVLQPPENADNTLATLRNEMRDVWQSHGFDPGRAGRGNIRDLAEAANLLGMYDYFYELASRLVHFSPSVLLRSGWGSLQADEIDAFLRPSNFNHYYSALARSHSVLLLAEFIERFGTDLHLPDSFAAAARSIRNELKSIRLPEIVTFEEMNLKPPGVVLRVIETMVRTGEIPAERINQSID